MYKIISFIQYMDIDSTLDGIGFTANGVKTTLVSGSENVKTAIQNSGENVKGCSIKVLAIIN